MVRLGGDEFALLLPEARQEQAKLAADRVFERIDRLMQERQWPVSMSAGVVTVETPHTVDEVIQAADAMMYRAKKGGKKAAVFQTLGKELICGPAE